MREATNQSEELLLRDSTFTMPKNQQQIDHGEMTFQKDDDDGDLIDEDDSSDEAQDTVEPLSVRSTLFDEHLLPSNN